MLLESLTSNSSDFSNSFCNDLGFLYLLHILRTVVFWTLICVVKITCLLFSLTTTSEVI